RSPTNLVLQTDSGQSGNVLEFSGAQVSPELAAPDLVDEKQVDLPVAIDIRRRQSCAVIVNGRFHVPCAIVHDVMVKSDLAAVDFIGELEAVKGLELFGRCELFLLSPL